MKAVNGESEVHARYTKMRRGIFSHPVYIDASNVEQLREMKFVFLCFDAGQDQGARGRNLEKFGVPFVDVGMGVYLSGDSLGGIVKTTPGPARARNEGITMT